MLCFQTKRCCFQNEKFIGCFCNHAFEDVQAVCCELNLQSLRTPECSDLQCSLYGFNKPCYLSVADYTIYKESAPRILSDMDPGFWSKPAEEPEEIDTKYLYEEELHS